MLESMHKDTDALAEAINNALDRGITPDDLADIVAAQQPRTLNELVRELGAAGQTDELPLYAEPPPGMIDVATAVKKHGLKARTVKGWIHRGLLPATGKVRGIGGTRFLVCEETVAAMAGRPKNRGGRPRKT